MADRAAARAEPDWAKAGAVAAALHVAVIGGAMLVVGAPPPAPPAGATFAVTMAPAPPTDMAAGAVQDEATPEPAVAPEVKLPFTPPPESDARSAIQLPKPADRPAPATPAPPAPAVAAATTRPPAAPVAPQPAPAAPAAASGVASDAWQARLLAQLERNKRYPAKARYFRQQDTVYVQFTMNRQGKLLSSKIVKSAGYAEIDGEVLALLKRVQPLTLPPADVPGDPLTRTVAIQFYLS